MATQTCGSRQEQVQILEGTTLKIPDKCNIQLRDHMIYGEKSLQTTVEAPKVFDWKWEAKRLLHYITESHFD